MYRTTSLSVGTALFLGFVLTSSSDAQTARAKVRTGVPLTGAPVGHLVTSIDSVTMNHNGVAACGVTTSNGTQTLDHVFVEGNPLRTQQANLANFNQVAYDKYFGLDDSLRVVYSSQCSQILPFQANVDTLWIDTAPIYALGQAIPGLAGRKWGFIVRPNVTGGGIPYWVGGIFDIVSGAFLGEGLFRGTPAVCLLKTGDPVPPGLGGGVLASDAIGERPRFSRLGTHYITQINPPAGHVLLDGNAILTGGGNQVSWGDVVPTSIGGTGTETWVSFDSMGVTELGYWFLTGRTSSPTTSDGVLMRGGLIFQREGDAVDGVTLLGNPGPAAMNEQEDVAVVWDTVGGFDTLFVDGMIALREGDAVDWNDDGVVDPGIVITDFTGVDSVAIGPRVAGAVRVGFTAEVDNGGTLIESFFTLDVQIIDTYERYCFGDGVSGVCPCGNNAGLSTTGGCLSSLGLPSRLHGSGNASISSDTFVLSGTSMPNGPTLYYQGTNQVSSGNGTPFGDGLRCAGGTLVRLGVKTNVSNASQYPAPGDPSVSVRALLTTPVTRTYQAWYRDSAVFCTPSSFNLTNGVRVIWAP